jgi:hypothetical protein
MSRHRTTAGGVLLSLIVGLSGAVAASANGATAPTPIVFPLIGKALLTGSWGDPRPNGRHQGEDIIAPRRAPVVAAEAGRVKWWRSSVRAGCMLYLYGRSGTTYLYIHLNNDRSLQNDNDGGCNGGTTYVAKDGAVVEAGELIAWNGDSGDADGNPHLHFEVHPQNGADVDPLPYLKAGSRHLFPAKLGTPFTLALRGTLIAAGNGRLELTASAVRWWPNGRWTEIDPRPIELAVPTATPIEDDLLELAAGTQRSPSTRAATALTVFTEEATVTAAALRGDPGALTAARITKQS